MKHILVLPMPMGLSASIQAYDAPTVGGTAPISVSLNNAIMCWYADDSAGWTTDGRSLRFHR